MIKFSVLSLILIPGIPSQNQVSQLEVIFLGSSVKDLLNVLLDDLRFVENLLSGLLQLNNLIDPSLGVPVMKLLQEIQADPNDS